MHFGDWLLRLWGRVGLTTESILFLAESWLEGPPVRSVLTLGKQDLLAAPERLELILRQHDLWPPSAETPSFKKAMKRSPWRAAELFRWMGAKEVKACDASAYEGADVIHDLNEPLPPSLEEQFDLVIDGGTLEHVFNLPVALSNCMRAVRAGGRLILFTPANNYCGHGFYQFSPELFWRTLSEPNGFKIERMHAMVDSEGFSSFLGVRYPFPIRGQRHEVADPAVVRERVLLVNDSPVLLFVEARKTAHCAPFRNTPQQSDYTAHWENRAKPEPLKQKGLRSRVASGLKRIIPERAAREKLPGVLRWLDLGRERRFRRDLSFDNRDHYRPVNTPEEESE